MLELTFLFYSLTLIGKYASFAYLWRFIFQIESCLFSEQVSVIESIIFKSAVVLDTSSSFFKVKICYWFI